MKIIEGQDVCVAEPFPLQELSKAVQWTYCFKTMIFDDSGPKTNDEIKAFLQALFTQPHVRSWAIVDKNNLTHVKDDLPLVGFIYSEHVNPHNCYMGIVTHRRAQGSIIETEGTRQLVQSNKDIGEAVRLPSMAMQARQLVHEELFKSPDLYRISGVVQATNKKAYHHLMNLGFKREGYLANMLCIKGQPTSVIHMGLMRPEAI